jgi:hypothetical protein
MFSVGIGCCLIGKMTKLINYSSYDENILFYLMFTSHLSGDFST